MAATKESKSKRSKSRCEKYSAALKSHIHDHRGGDGIRIRYSNSKSNNARYVSNSTARNPTGTPRVELKCRFHHPLFCTTLGHASCRSKECSMHSKSKVKRDSTAKIILDEMINRKLHLIHEERE